MNRRTARRGRRGRLGLAGEGGGLIPLVVAIDELGALVATAEQAQLMLPRLIRSQLKWCILVVVASVDDAVSRMP